MAAGDASQTTPVQVIVHVFMLQIFCFMLFDTNNVHAILIPMTVLLHGVN